MSDPQDVSSVMEAAAQAAGAGDFVSAERELRRGLALQEAVLGPAHPDLANTLNNLGVVAERLNKPADAERSYRRAYAIASGVLQPDHPFVVMSAKNLRDFCDARGIPFERSLPPSPAVAVADPQTKASWPPPRKADAAPPAAAASAQPPGAPAPTRPPTEPKGDPVPAAAQPKRKPVPAAAPAPLPAPEPSTSPRLLVIAAIVLAAIIVGGVWTMWSSRTSGKVPEATSAPAPSASATPAPPTATPAPAPAEPVTPPPDPAPVQDPAAPPPAAAAAPAESRKAEPDSPAPTPKQNRPTATSSGVAATLVSAQLCHPLTPSGSWNCTPASNEMSPGVVFFYTRVTCPADTTIEHRWYLNDRLLQNVPLRIRANSGSGYRTYSRMTISPERTGDWRVELRTTNGAVLHEERFSVAR